VQPAIKKKSWKKRGGKTRKMFSCIICGMKFVYLAMRNRHVRKHCEDFESGAKSSCGKIPSAAVQKPSMKADEKPPNAPLKRRTKFRIAYQLWNCSECVQQMNSRQKILLHFRSHAGTDASACHDCRSVFRRGASFDHHTCLQRRRRKTTKPAIDTSTVSGRKSKEKQEAKNAAEDVENINKLSGDIHDNEEPASDAHVGNKKDNAVRKHCKDSNQSVTPKKCGTGSRDSIREPSTTAALKLSSTSLQKPKGYKPSSAPVKQHNSVGAGDKLWNCGECGRQMNSRKSILIHFHSHAGTKVLVCLFCNSVFRKRGGFDSHPCVAKHNSQASSTDTWHRPVDSVPISSRGPETVQDAKGFVEGIGEDVDELLADDEDDEMPVRDSETKNILSITGAKRVKSGRGSSRHSSEVFSFQTIRRCYIKLVPLRADVVAASSLTDRPAASFVDAAAVADPTGSNSCCSCFFCEGAVFSTKGNLLVHYNFSHFRRQYLQHYSRSAKPPFVCRLCGATATNLKHFCHHVGMGHDKLKERLPLAAWKALCK
jgi:hypothetical protein